MAGKIRMSGEDGVGKSPALTATLEPSSSRGKGSDSAFNDAVLMVVLSWFALFLLMYSLRHHIL